MLINFFYTLRAAKLKVSVKEYLSLLEAIQAGVIDNTVDEFYYLARTSLVKPDPPDPVPWPKSAPAGSHECQ